MGVRCSLEAMRSLAAFVVMALVLSACATKNDDASTPPAITASIEAALSVAAISEVCRERCEFGIVYMRDELLNAATLDGNQKPMPTPTRAAISQAFPSASLLYTSPSPRDRTRSR